MSTRAPFESAGKRDKLLAALSQPDVVGISLAVSSFNDVLIRIVRNPRLQTASGNEDGTDGEDDDKDPDFSLTRFHSSQNFEICIKTPPRKGLGSLQYCLRIFSVFFKSDGPFTSL